MNNILIIEDHQNTRKGLARLLKGSGYYVDEADNGLEAESLITGGKYDLILVDLILPQVNGLRLLKKAKEISPGTEVIVMTGHETIDSAIDAMKLGAYEYLLKPLEPQKIIETVNQAIEKKNLFKDSPTQSEPWIGSPCLMGRSKQMVDIFKLLAKSAQTESPVLIIGEAGTGKRTLAKAIHQNCPRRSDAFIMLNCALIRDDLSEKQALSYLKEKIIENGGLSESGHFNGTLYLENIDMASPLIQKSLLLILSNQFPSSDQKNYLGYMRLIASSRKNLKILVDKKSFLQDLFFRINVISITVPPLRERKVDIPLLTDHFLHKYAISPARSLSSEALDLFLKYQWPGNIQELKNVTEYAVLMASQGQIKLEDLPGYLKSREFQIDQSVSGNDLTLKEVEKIYIIKKLEATRWDQQKTANLLGIGRTTLWRKLKEYGILAPRRKKLEG